MSENENTNPNNDSDHGMVPYEIRKTAAPAADNGVRSHLFREGVLQLTEHGNDNGDEMTCSLTYAFFSDRT